MKFYLRILIFFIPCILLSVNLTTCERLDIKPLAPDQGNAPVNTNIEIRGAVMAHVHQFGEGYGSGRTRKIYRRLKILGVNSIQLNSFAYQKNRNTIGLSWGDPTLSHSALLKEIKIIKSMGFTVMLKPHIWLGTSFSGEWRNQIDYKTPAEVDRWFKEYRRFLKGQVEVAIKGKAEFFAVGTELVMLTKYTERWNSLIAWIRSLGYRGKLTYACEAWNARNIKFWPALDQIGLDYYYGYDKENFTAKELEQYYIRRLKEHLAHAKSLNKPLVLTEFGFPSHSLAIKQPHAWGDGKVQADQQKQIFAYRIFRRALKKTGGLNGIYIWKYVTSLMGYEARAYPKGFIMQGKPAEDEIKKIFKRAETKP